MEIREPISLAEKRLAMKRLAMNEKSKLSMSLTLAGISLELAPLMPPAYLNQMKLTRSDLDMFQVDQQLDPETLERLAWTALIMGLSALQMLTYSTESKIPSTEIRFRQLKAEQFLRELLNPAI